ncbi:MAG: thiamine diphosphokinase [Bacteroidota bacterium]|nr:thiamine diphosphokinase [Bacteroidota bacterium]
MTRTAVIVAAGDFPTKPYPLYLLQAADIIVCCDSAFAKYLRRMHRIFGGERLPDAVIGDMDSLSKPLRRAYADRIVHETEQDHNDQTKAVRYVLGHYPDVSEIHILGATGLRADHTIGNLSLLMEYPRMFASLPPIDIVSDYGTAFAVLDSTELHVGAGRRFSLFSPDNSLRIRSEGLQWPTDDVVFDNWWKATLNRTSADIVRLSFSHPSRALIILD